MKLTVNLMDPQERNLARAVLDMFVDDEETISLPEEIPMPEPEEVPVPVANASVHVEEVLPTTEKVEAPKAKVPKAKKDTPAPEETDNAVASVVSLEEVQNLAKELVSTNEIALSDLQEMLAKYNGKKVSALSDEDRGRFYADCLSKKGEANV